VVYAAAWSPMENDSSANLRSGFTWLHSFFSASCRKK